MGTISDKLTYLTTTKGKIKDAINLTGANILSEDTFRSYADKLKQGLVDAINDGGSTIYSNFPKTTGEGTEIALNNVYTAPMRTTLKGNTQQDSYTGINLLTFPYYETTKTINGITFTVQNDGIVHVEGTATAKAQFKLRIRDLSLDLNIGERYTIATSGLGVIDSTIWLDTYGQTGSFLGKWALTSSIPYASAVAEAKDIKPFISIAVENGATVNIDVKVWLYKGSYDETKTYEPFVGGFPSPSPDYPQPVKVVTGNNTIVVSDGTNTDNYSLNLGSIELCKIGDYQDEIKKSTGKNLFDYPNNIINNGNLSGGTTMKITSDNNCKLSYIQCKPNTTYTISRRNPMTNRFFVATTENTPTIGETLLSINETYNDTTTSITITTPNNANYIVIRFINNQINDYETYAKTIQIEQGETATSYEPYGKVWYKKAYIGKVVLDGSENWGNFQVESTGLGRAIGIGSNVLYQDNQATLLSNKLAGVKYSGSWNNTFECIATMSSNRFITYLKNVSNLTEFTTKLASGYEVYYVLETPTGDKITDNTLINQLEELKKAKSVDDKTFISQTNANLPFIISASALSKN